MTSTTITILQPDSKPAETLGAALIADAKAINVNDQASADSAVDFVRSLATQAKAVAEMFKESKDSAHKTHKAITTLEKSLITPLKAARKTVEAAIYEWEERERAKAAEARRLIEDAERKAEEERRLERAQEAQDMGAQEEASRLLDVPAPAREIPTLTSGPVAAKASKSSGVSAVKRWSAEVVGIHELVVFVANNPEHIGLLAPNMPALNKMATALKDGLAVPGVRPICTTSRMVR